MRALIIALCALACAVRAAAQADFFILLEDGTRKTYGDLRGLSPHKCCFKVDFGIAVTYSSSNRLRMFNSDTTECNPAFEINSSTFPAIVKMIDLCATGCDPNKGCGINGMDKKGVSTKGGRWPLNQGQECAYSDGRTMDDKTCKAVSESNVFKYRLMCVQDCTNKWTCQEPNFDKSKCANAPASAPVTTFVAIGQKCGYTQDNKRYECGGNHTKCTNGVCASTFPSGRKLV